MIHLLIKKIIEWIKEHIFGVIAGAAVIGAGAGAAGIANAHKAKKINKEAIAIQQAALEKHELAYEKLQRDLAKLGQTEKNAIDSFVLFADAIERIQNRPKIRTPLFSKVKLPNYEPEELKQLSTSLQTVIETGIGASLGALAGLAAFGANAVVAAPAMVAAGTVLCVKGCGLKKKAVANKKQAKKMSESVDEIIDFYSQLRETANSYQDSMSSVYNKYMECINRIMLTLTQKTSWKDFSREEKKNVENTVMLAKLLYQMCKTELIIQHKDAEKLEDINTTEINVLEKDAQKLLANCG